LSSTFLESSFLSVELSGSKPEFFSFFHSDTEGVGITIGTEELSGLSSDSKSFEVFSLK